MRNYKAYIWSFANKIGTQLVWLITTMVLARFLAPNEFGMIGVLSIIFMVANTLSDSGLGGALIIQKKITDEDCASIFLFNAFVSISLYIAIFFSADFVESFYNVQGLASVARCLGLVFVINSLGVVPRSLLFHRLQFKSSCINGLISIILSSLTAIIMAYFNCGVYSLVAYQVVSATVSTLGAIIITKYQFPLKFKWQNLKKLFNFGAYTTLTSVIESIYENMMAPIYGKYLSMSEAGYLSQAKRVEEAASMSLVGTVNNTSFPILSKLKDDIDLFKKEADSMQQNVPIVIFPILVVVAVYSKELIYLLFGEKWLPSSQYLSILVIAGMFMVLENINRNFIKSLGYVSILFKYTIIKRVIACLIVLVAGFISVEYMLYGYVFSTFLGFVINSTVYAMLINANKSSAIIKSLKSLAPIIPLYIVIYSLYRIIDILSLKIAISVIVLGLFYLIILPMIGIDLKGKIMKLKILNKQLK